MRFAIYRFEIQRHGKVLVRASRVGSSPTWTTMLGSCEQGFFVTADPGKRDVEVKVLIDCTAEEIDVCGGCSTTSWGSGACLCGGTWRSRLARMARWLAKTQVPRGGGSEDDEAPVP
ncbi:hypothetical protein [Parafrankia soli]|uniref:hypothetical protein n=1 Tax=Parafrankia soli TaxID=2599596 RepID=UPI000A8809F7|nr:hypothetical protein [Parafrankia soli]